MVSNSRRSVERLPLLIVATLVVAANLFVAVVRLTEPLAVAPWEPSIAMEAMRLNAGLPVYASGHATHMYGPLLTVLFAGVFRFTGLSLIAARTSISLFSIALAVFLALLFARNRTLPSLCLAVVLFVGINLRTSLVFFSVQPDSVAALIGSVALVVWAKRGESLIRWVAAILLFVTAMLFKQTAAAFALIPVVFALLWTPRAGLLPQAASFLPTISILVVLAAMRIYMPDMFHAVVTVPASIKVYPRSAVIIAVYLLTTFPLFLIGLVSLLSKRRAVADLEGWVAASLIVLVPASIWATSKSGGSYNSLLPAYCALTALFVVRMELVFKWVTETTFWRSALASVCVSLSIVVSFFAQANWIIPLLAFRAGDEKYSNAVAILAQLKQGVASPQDPTIAYRAKGIFGSSLFFELDTHAINGNWPDKLPEAISSELERAKFVIEVKSYVPTPMFERGLNEHGFVPVFVPDLRDSCYSLWAKPD